VVAQNFAKGLRSPREEGTKGQKKTLAGKAGDAGDFPGKPESDAGCGFASSGQEAFPL
jgi:hypothetical protein